MACDSDVQYPPRESERLLRLAQQRAFRSERVLRRRRVEELVREIHEASYGIYGYRKVHRAVVDRDLRPVARIRSALS